MSHNPNRHLLACVHKHKPQDQGRIGAHLEGTHQHLHEHSLHRPRQKRALGFCVLLTLIMMIVEFVAGVWWGSLMLMSDAIHMLSHAAALSISFFAMILAHQKTEHSLSYGLYRVEVLAALLNGISLAGFSGWIVFQGLGRLLHPTVVLGYEVTLLALLGLAVNVVTAVILQRAGMEDLNTKSAFLHMLADIFSSIVIVVGGLIISLTDWFIIDPILAMVVAGIVAKWSWELLKDSICILLERSPQHVDIKVMQKYLQENIPDIHDVHDVHIWEITSQYICLSAHVVLSDVRLSETEGVRKQITESLCRHFGICHAVIQFESSRKRQEL